MDNSMIFNVLIKKEGKEYVAHCLELDIVATAATRAQIKADIKNLIITQVDYAFSNDNLENLYHPAPSEVWKEFYACKNSIEKKIRMKSEFKNNIFVPPWIIANTCFAWEGAAVG